VFSLRLEIERYVSCPRFRPHVDTFHPNDRTRRLFGTLERSSSGGAHRKPRDEVLQRREGSIRDVLGFLSSGLVAYEMCWDL
jgi:hypothetical protein